MITAFYVNLFNKIAENSYNINIKYKEIRCYETKLTSKRCADKMIFFFFKETPTSPLDQYRAKFRPLRRVFRPNRPQTEPLLSLITVPYMFGCL